MECYIFKKSIALLCHTWYILIPAKKTQLTRCGKPLKTSFERNLKKELAELVRT
ncbi:hypothetical protein SAMN05720606_1331 [Paenibacillus polysaccharolyticus]|uniref:Uncharacterized protein n=1 Tax=Paenibacillus polysaccharolyticus TaxID=582692 RepID=A0A1G5LQP9_9BACL|nr:hypothetical protein SAMN05720606_1331 [Paenibacillus polysaccharolyticus]